MNLCMMSFKRSHLINDIILMQLTNNFSLFILPGWEVAGDHIRSGAGSSDNDYLILNIHIPGFKYATLPSFISHL